MSKFNELEFKSYLWKGKLHEAVNYLSKFQDKKDWLQKYINIFEEGQYYKRTDNQIIGDIDKIYQKYYRNVFWMNMSNEEAKKLLFHELKTFGGAKSDLLDDDNIEEEIERIVKREGYECLCGDTSGFYGPYIWKSSTTVTYEVELPSGIEPYTIIMMDGFISRSWLDFISFGKTGTGGWVGKDGTLCCVRSLYDTESEEFNISFLKHEAQHAYDKKRYSDTTTTDLEYRAKLVELTYYSNDEKIKEIFNEADNINPDNGHSVAAHRIISEMSQKIFGCEYMNDEKAWENKLDNVKKYARELLEESSESLKLENAIQ